MCRSYRARSNPRHRGSKAATAGGKVKLFSASAKPGMDAISATAGSAAGELFQAAKKAGATGVAASYLFLRSKLKKPILNVLAALGAGGMNCKTMLAEAVPLTIDAQGATVLAPPVAYRKEGYERARAVARRLDLPLRICGCKNRDLTTEACGLARSGECPRSQTR